MGSLGLSLVQPGPRVDNIASDEEWPPGGLEQSERLFGPAQDDPGEERCGHICLGNCGAPHARVDLECDARWLSCRSSRGSASDIGATPRALIHNAQRIRRSKMKSSRLESKSRERLHWTGTAARSGRTVCCYLRTSGGPIGLLRCIPLLPSCNFLLHLPSCSGGCE